MDYKTNTLYVVNNGLDRAIYNDRLTVKNVNWLDIDRPKLPFKCQVVIRYRHQPVNCLITRLGRNYSVKLAQAQRAIMPGQSAVFYQKDKMLGGGIICQN
jgi:tRNA-uridine 2-sulfurtransferase